MATRKKNDPKTDIINAALELAPSHGWSLLSFADIADGAGVTLGELHSHFPTKSAILDAFMRDIDQAVLRERDTSGTQSVRDRLFDIVMRRFDALAPHRDAVQAILRDLALDPCIALVLIPGFWRSVTWMLEAADVSAFGFAGLVRCKGLSVLYLNAFRVWLSDDTEDFSETMATLDGGLRQADRLLCALKFGCDDAEARPV